MMKYITAIPVLMLISILFPVAMLAQWLAAKLMTTTILLVDCLPELER